MTGCAGQKEKELREHEAKRTNGICEANLRIVKDVPGLLKLIEILFDFDGLLVLIQFWLFDLMVIVRFMAYQGGGCESAQRPYVYYSLLCSRYYSLTAWGNLERQSALICTVTLAVFPAAH